MGDLKHTMVLLGASEPGGPLALSCRCPRLVTGPHHVVTMHTLTSAPPIRSYSEKQLGPARKTLLAGHDFDSAEKVRLFKERFTQLGFFEWIRNLFGRTDERKILNAIAICHISCDPAGREHLEHAEVERSALYLLDQLTPTARNDMLAQAMLTQGGAIVLRFEALNLSLPLTTSCFSGGQGALNKAEAKALHDRIIEQAKEVNDWSAFAAPVTRPLLALLDLGNEQSAFEAPKDALDLRSKIALAYVKNLGSTLEAARAERPHSPLTHIGNSYVSLQPGVKRARDIQESAMLELRQALEDSLGKDIVHSAWCTLEQANRAPLRALTVEQASKLVNSALAIWESEQRLNAVPNLRQKATSAQQTIASAFKRFRKVVEEKRRLASPHSDWITLSYAPKSATSAVAQNPRAQAIDEKGMVTFFRSKPADPKYGERSLSVYANRLHFNELGSSKATAFSEPRNTVSRAYGYLPLQTLKPERLAKHPLFLPQHLLPKHLESADFIQLEENQPRDLAINGGTSLDKISENKTIPWKQFEAISLGLKRLHEDQLYHRDISPFNMTQRNDGTIYVIDCDSVVESKQPRATSEPSLTFRKGYTFSDTFHSRWLKTNDEYAFLRTALESCFGYKATSDKGNRFELKQLEQFVQSCVLPQHRSAVLALLQGRRPLPDNVHLHDLLNWMPLVPSDRIPRSGI